MNIFKRAFFIFFCLLSFYSVSKEVVINQQVLSAEQIEHIEMKLGYDIQAGHYWYDAESGLWGLANQAAIGQTQKGLVNNKVLTNASNGHSGVFINGRELCQQEAYFCQQHSKHKLAKGHYWLNEAGHLGLANKTTELVLHYPKSTRAFCHRQTNKQVYSSNTKADLMLS
ncbi:hypothetical protein ACMZOO_16220 [Catenovulum sp. SX2]|uniref:hypothetical protein n=1 Tax=Catenovulum sp. SX2 TaxID=3398614 RepID=UPI003F840451